MANRVPIEYLQSVRDKKHDLFLHYSLIRMAILAFLLPLGMMIMIQDKDQPCAGLLLIGVAVLLNLIFGAWSFNAHVIYDYWHKWLKRETCGATFCEDPGEVVIHLLRQYSRAVFSQYPIKESDLCQLKNKGWKNSLIEQQGKVKLSKEWRIREPIIQFFVFGTIGGFIFFAIHSYIGLIVAGIYAVICILIAVLTWVIARFKRKSSVVR